jgi:hypothetical protein
MGFHHKKRNGGWNPAKRSIEFWGRLDDLGLDAAGEWWRLYNQLDESDNQQLALKIAMLHKLMEYGLQKPPSLQSTTISTEMNTEMSEQNISLLKQITAEKIKQECLQTLQTSSQSLPPSSPLESPGESSQPDSPQLKEISNGSG